MSVDYYKIDRNIGSNFMESDSKAWACFTIPLRTLLTRVYEWKQIRRNFSLNNIKSIARKRHDKIASYASCAFMEIWLNLFTDVHVNGTKARSKKILSQREVSRHSVWTTIAHITIWCRKEFVYIIGSTAFHRNFHCIPAAGTSSKAYRPSYFTIFHCRMVTFKPARPICATSEFWNTRC